MKALAIAPVKEADNKFERWMQALCSALRVIKIKRANNGMLKTMTAEIAQQRTFNHSIEANNCLWLQV